MEKEVSVEEVLADHQNQVKDLPEKAAQEEATAEALQVEEIAEELVEVMVEAVQKEHMDKGVKVNLRKPHPFSLLRSTETMNPFRFALYVGDSMEDAITVTKSRESDMRFLFAGVYRYSSIEKDLQESFLKYGCDLILPSVNDLPFVLETIRSEENESRRNIQKNK